MKIKLSLVLVIALMTVSFCFGQKVEWPVEIGGPALRYNSSSFETDYYLYKWYRYENFPSDEGYIHRYDGKKWERLPDVDASNSSLQEIVEDANHLIAVDFDFTTLGHDFSEYNEATKTWNALISADSFGGYWAPDYHDSRIREICLYKDNLYFIGEDDETKGALLSYDFDTKKSTVVLHYGQNEQSHMSSNQVSLFVHNNKLYLAGAYDYVDANPCEGYGYFDGSEFTPLNIFNTSPPHNTVVKKVSNQELVAIKFHANGNDVSKSSIYLLKNDAVKKDITFNCFTRQNANDTRALSQMNSYHMEVFKMDGKVILDVGVAFVEFDDDLKKWDILNFDSWDLNAYHFKNNYYLFTSSLHFPHEQYPRFGSFKVSNVDQFRSLLFADLDKDCELTMGDQPVRNKWLAVKGNGIDISVSSDHHGFINLKLEKGNYQLALNDKNLNLSDCFNDSIELDSAALSGSMAIAARFNKRYDGKTDLVTTLSNGPARRGRDLRIGFLVENIGSLKEVTRPVFTYDKRLLFKSCNVPVNANKHGVLDFGEDSLSFFNPMRATVHFSVHQDSVKVGDTLHFMGSSSIIASELDSSNNRTKYSVEITGPLDPNNMISNPSDTIQYSPEYINYTVNFQNYGTDTAFDVRITDQLPTALDHESIKILDHSGPNIKSTVENGLLTFFLDEIQLAPKSIDETGSQGYVTFRLDLTQELFLGSPILNNADIFFDYEEPVRTNDAILLKSVAQSVEGNILTLGVYPSPASSVAHITGLPTHTQFAQLANASGREWSVALENNSDLDVSQLESGIYWLKVYTPERTYMAQVMVD